MVRSLAVVAGVATLWAGLRAPLGAQTAIPCPAGSYDACALRVERGRLYRGMPGEDLGRSARSDSAAPAPAATPDSGPPPLLSHETHGTCVVAVVTDGDTTRCDDG